ncbi:hypothetical protein [Thalassobaculum sp.]|uniref:hypothetical protein n=1 Tax=Thalassobaculum sp. TaxID=2022740 RepID=UPI0032EB9992
MESDFDTSDFRPTVLDMADGVKTLGRGTAWLKLAVVGVSFSFGLPSALAGAHEHITAMLTDHRTVEISDHLLVNVDASRRFLFPGKCQNAGELELTALSATSELEESFIFVPETCTWIEAGHSETGRSVLLDTALTYAVARQYLEIAIYHIQPGRRLALVNHLPSYRDLVSMVLVDTELMDAPQIRVRHRAVTRFAVIDYRFADWAAVRRRAEVYRRSGLGAHLAQNLAYEFSQEVHQQSYAAQVRQCASRLENVPSRIAECRRLATDLFVLDIRTVRLAAR